MTASNGNTGKGRLKWLEEAGWLVLLKKGTRVLASEYRLQIPAELKGGTPLYTPSSEASEGVWECNHLLQDNPDVFIGWSMGLTIMFQLANMGSGTSKQIAQSLDRNHSSIKKNLEALRMFGLVSLEDGVYKPTITEGRLQEVAQARGKAGRIVQAMQRTKDQAEARREYLSEHGMLSHKTANELRRVQDRRYEPPGGFPPSYAYMSA
jgi:hypothetical protein